MWLQKLTNQLSHRKSGQIIKLGNNVDIHIQYSFIVIIIWYDDIIGEKNDEKKNCNRAPHKICIINWKFWIIYLDPGIKIAPLIDMLVLYKIFATEWGKKLPFIAQHFLTNSALVYNQWNALHLRCART